MVPHHVAVDLVAEEVDAARRRPVRRWHAHHLLGHDDGSWLAERVCDVEVGKKRRQEREVCVQWPASPVDGLAQRVIHLAFGEQVRKLLRLRRENLCEEGNLIPLS